MCVPWQELFQILGVCEVFNLCFKICFCGCWELVKLNQSSMPCVEAVMYQKGWGRCQEQVRLRLMQLVMNRTSSKAVKRKHSSLRSDTECKLSVSKSRIPTALAIFIVQVLGNSHFVVIFFCESVYFLGSHFIPLTFPLGMGWLKKAFTLESLWPHQSEEGCGLFLMTIPPS